MTVSDGGPCVIVACSRDRLEVFSHEIVSGDDETDLLLLGVPDTVQLDVGEFPVQLRDIDWDHFPVIVNDWVRCPRDIEAFTLLDASGVNEPDGDGGEKLIDTDADDDDLFTEGEFVIQWDLDGVRIDELVVLDSPLREIELDNEADSARGEIETEAVSVADLAAGETLIDVDGAEFVQKTVIEDDIVAESVAMMFFDMERCCVMLDDIECVRVGGSVRVRVAETAALLLIDGVRGDCDGEMDSDRSLTRVLVIVASRVSVWMMLGVGEAVSSLV